MPASNNPDVPELVRRAQAGDVAAFAHLVEHHQPALGRFCRRLMVDPSLAQDLAQETLLRAYQAIGRLEEPSRFGAWLFGIAANLARKWWERQARRPLSLDSLAAGHPNPAWEAALAEPPPQPDQAFEEAERARRLLDAISALPESLRQTVVLHYLEDLSYAEVAAALEVPVSTVKGWLFKSRSRLRRQLAGTDTTPAVAGTTRVPRPPRKRKKKGELAAMRSSSAPDEGATRQTPEAVAAPAAGPSAAAGAEPAAPGVLDQVQQVIAQRLRLLAIWYRPEGTRLQDVQVPSDGIGLSEGACHALAAAEEEARQLNHNYLGTEHVLLGLLRQDKTVAAHVLTHMGAALPKARELLSYRIGRGDRPVTGPLNLVPRVKKVIELAVDEARRLKHEQLGTEHLLLGLVREGGGVGALILESLGVDLDAVRTAVLQAMAKASPTGEAPNQPATTARCAR